MASATEPTKNTARNARATADSAATTARAASEQAQRNIRTIMRDSAYATLGVGDLAVSAVRNLNQKAAELRAEAPRNLKTGVDPRELAARLERRAELIRTGATKEFDRLSDRGRGLLEGVQRSSSTKKAVDQVGVARSQVKAATTSVAKATRFVGRAAEESVEKVGDDTPVDYNSKTLDELIQIARQRDIAGRSTMNRDELVKALQSE